MLFFAAPHSYTGEHVVEFHGHGGPSYPRASCSAIELGARRARPGEFTQRAFLNDKIDLAQAEAVADLIDAGSREAARAAMRSLQGEFSSMVHGLVDAVTELRAWVEAAIDFPEEEIDFLADRELEARLAGIREHFAAVERSARQGRLLRDGMTVVIAGRPNAGKSSLLNRLAGYDAAIVTGSPAPRAISCASASTSTACRCTCSTPPACATRPMSSRPKGSAARPLKWRAPTACSSSSTRQTTRTRARSPTSARACRPTCP